MFIIKRASSVFFILAIVTTACNNKTPEHAKESTAVRDDCTDVPKLGWQIESNGIDDSAASKFIADIQAAANVDLTESKTVSAKADLSSELAKFVKQSVQQSSSVSQKFWEQDITYREIICLYSRKMGDSTLPQSVRSKFSEAILSLNQARAEYMLEAKKKDQP